MEDKISLARLQLLHPSIRQDAIAAYNQAVQLTPKGIHPFITQTLRTFEESDALYQKGRTAGGQIVTNAKAGQSFHNYGLALDFVIQVNGKENWHVDENWLIVVDCFKKHGFSWGGDWKSLKDYPHFEKTHGYTWQSLLALHAGGNFIEGNKYVNLV